MLIPTDNDWHDETIFLIAENASVDRDIILDIEAIFLKDPVLIPRVTSLLRVDLKKEVFLYGTTRLPNNPIFVWDGEIKLVDYLLCKKLGVHLYLVNYTYRKDSGGRIYKDIIDANAKLDKLLNLRLLLN